MAYSEDEECAALCKGLVNKLADSKIPPSLSMWRNSLLYLLQQGNEIGHEDILDCIDLLEFCSVSLVQFGNILNAKTAGILFKVLLICMGNALIEDDKLVNELIRSPSRTASRFLSEFWSGMEVYYNTPTNFPSAAISSVNLKYLFSKCSEVDPLETLEEGRREVAQSQTRALFSLQEKAFHLNMVISIVVAFMQERTRVPLIHDRPSLWKISKLLVKMAPMTIHSMVPIINSSDELLDSNDEESEDAKLFKSMKPMADYVQQNLYKNSTLEVDSYVFRLQLLVIGADNAFCLSEPCKKYFLEAQLMRTCQQLNITRATPTEMIISKWDKLFKRTTLFSVTKSFRPLIARWIRWSLMIHNLRHELAKFTAVGVVGLVNSGKSQLVNKLFQIKVCICFCVFHQINNGPLIFLNHCLKLILRTLYISLY